MEIAKTPVNIKALPAPDDRLHGSTTEAADDYAFVRFYINSRWRISSCAAGRQWILQERLGPDRWQARTFSARKASLGRVIKRHCGAKAWEKVRHLAAALPI
jgi:hypothetical protein